MCLLYACVSEAIAHSHLLHFCSNLLGKLRLLCGTEVGVLPDQLSIQKVLHGPTVQLVLRAVLPTQQRKDEEV